MLPDEVVDTNGFGNPISEVCTLVPVPIIWLKTWGFATTSSALLIAMGFDKMVFFVVVDGDTVAVQIIFFEIDCAIFT